MKAFRYFAALAFTIVYGVCFVAVVTHGEPSDPIWYNALFGMMKSALTLVGCWRLGAILVEGPGARKP